MPERNVNFAEIPCGWYGGLLRRRRPICARSLHRWSLRAPLGTLIINVSGSFLIGLVLTLLARTTASAYWRYLIPIGFIGAYTTFSTFEYETLRAIQDGQLMTGLLNVALSLVTGFIAVWAGAAIGRVLV